MAPGEPPFLPPLPEAWLFVCADGSCTRVYEHTPRISSRTHIGPHRLPSVGMPLPPWRRLAEAWVSTGGASGLGGVGTHGGQAGPMLAEGVG